MGLAFYSYGLKKKKIVFKRQVGVPRGHHCFSQVRELSFFFLLMEEKKQRHDNDRYAFLIL